MDEHDTRATRARRSRRQTAGTAPVPEEEPGRPAAPDPVEPARAPRRGQARATAPAGETAARPVAASSPAAELLAELSGLRATLAVVVEAIHARLRFRLAAIETAVESPAGHAMPRQTLKEMRNAVRAIKVKPERARMKDLRLLRDLVASLEERLPDQG